MMKKISFLFILLSMLMMVACSDAEQTTTEQSADVTTVEDKTTVEDVTTVEDKTTVADVTTVEDKTTVADVTTVEDMTSVDTTTNYEEDTKEVTVESDGSTEDTITVEQITTTEKVEKETTTSKVEKETTSKVEKETTTYTEIIPEFATGYVTKETTYVETEYVLYVIDPNVYVIGDLVQKTDELCKVIEKFTGLSFKHSGHEKIQIKVTKSNLGALSDSEYTGGMAAPGECESPRGDKCRNFISIESLDLFLGNSYSLLHELLHVLRFSQSKYMYNTVLEEGFAAYYTREIKLYLEKEKSSLAYALQSSCQIKLDMDYVVVDMYSKELTEWFALKADEFVGNDAYIYGDRLMAYLNAIYGDNVLWMSKLDDSSLEDYSTYATVEQVLEVFSATYGKDCLAGCYKWVKNNEAKINGYSDNMIYDMTGFEPVSMYPVFSWISREDCILSKYPIKYKNLYINIDEAVNYLKNYKDRNTDNLYLALSSEATVCTYDKNGKLLETVTGTRVSLKGVSYIRLVGEGKLDRLTIGGYYNKNEIYDKQTVIFTTTIEKLEQFNWNYFMSLEYDDIDMDLLYRTDIEVSVRLSAPCDVQVNRIDGDILYEGNKTEVKVSGSYWFSVFNIEKVTVEIVITPVK